MALSAISSSAHSAALSAFERTRKELAESVYRIASGNRYLSGQDSASLSLAVQLQADIASYRQGLNNSIHANSLLEVASAGLSRINDLLAHARELALQAGNDSVPDVDRALLQTALNSDLSQVDAIAQGASFNGKKLLNGDASHEDGGSDLSFTVGTGADSTITADIRNTGTDRLFSGGAPSLASADDAADAIDAINAAAALIGDAIGEIGGLQSRLDFVQENLDSQIAGADAARASIADTDIAEESARYTSRLTKQKVALAILAQSRNLNSGLLNLLGPGNTAKATAAT